MACILIRIFSSTSGQEMRKTRRNLINFLVVCIPNGRGTFDTRQIKYIPYFIDFSRRIFNFILKSTNARETHYITKYNYLLKMIKYIHESNQKTSFFSRNSFFLVALSFHFLFLLFYTCTQFRRVHCL